MNPYCKALFAGLLIIGLTGCVGKPHLPGQQETGVAQGPKVLVDAYEMSVGDEVQVTVWKNPELSVTEPIRPDGKIAIPLIGDVMAAGREPEALAADIKERLHSFIKKPNVTVILTRLQGHEFLSRIRVTGSVEEDMSMPYHRG